jgi:hypothetical protein
MSRRKLFRLAIVSALLVGTAALAQGGGGGGGGGGGAVVGVPVAAAVAARAAVAPRAETAVVRLREVQARRLRILGIQERRGRAPMLVGTIRTPTPGLILMIPIPKIG